jgi:hypothetical protein
MKKRNACRILVGKSEGKRLVGRPRHRWVDSIKIDIWLGEVCINTIRNGFTIISILHRLNGSYRDRIGWYGLD